MGLETILELDFHLLRSLQTWCASPGLDRLIWLTSQLGNGFLVAPLVLVYLLFRRTLPSWRALIPVTLVLSLLGLLVATIKHLVIRNRPPFGLLAGTSPGLTLSFPSGHTATAFAMVSLLMVLDPRTGRWLLPLAAAAGFSRMVQGVHFPSDVLVGALLGFLLPLLVLPPLLRYMGFSTTDTSRPPSGGEQEIRHE